MPMTSSGLKPFVVSANLIHPEPKGSKQVGRDRMLKGADVDVSTCSASYLEPPVGLRLNIQQRASSTASERICVFILRPSV